MDVEAHAAADCRHPAGIVPGEETPGSTTAVKGGDREQVECVLRMRVRQQRAVAELGQFALGTLDVQSVFDRAVQAVAQVLDIGFCSVLELPAEGGRFVMRAAAGWPRELVGRRLVAVSGDTQAGFTLISAEPVIVDDLAAETRFRVGSLLLEHQVVSGMSCVIPGAAEKAWGVLGAHSARRVRFTEDDVSFLQAIAHVVSSAAQRAAAEQALREGEERYRSIVDSALDAVVAMDEQGVVREWNESAAFVFGWAREEAIGRPLAWLIIPERFRPAHAEGLDRFLRTGDDRIFNRRIELPALRRDGCEFLTELTVVPVRTSEGHIFTAFLRDVTARKRAENLLQRKALEASLLHQATAVAAETDSFELALQSCVTIVCELTGWPVGHAFIRPTSESEQLVPTNIWHLSHPERFQRFVAVTEQSAFRRGEGIPGLIWSEGKAAWIPNVHKSDNFPRAKLEPQLEITAAFGFPVFVRGELEAVLEFFHPQEMPLDENLLLVAQAVGEQVGRVMERKRTRLALARQADELLQMNTELTRSNKELDDFAYIASHDLREPLRGIQNYATFLIEDYGEAIDDSGREKLETMRRLTQRLDELIESLLKFSRVGRLNLDVQPVDLNAVVTDACDSLQTLLTENLVEVRLPTLLPMVACDRVHAGEVFVNLISNAVKYNDKPQKLVEIGAIELPEDLGQGVPPEIADCAAPILFVRDNGIGIRDRHMESIFKIFKRLHGRDQFGGGSGAGLTIVKKIIERHGGRIWVDSTLGKGTTFYFCLGEHATPGSHPAPQRDASTSGEYAVGALT